MVESNPMKDIIRVLRVKQWVKNPEEMVIFLLKLSLVSDCKLYSFL